MCWRSIPAAISCGWRGIASFQDVQFVQSTFEDWSPQSARFKLVASAQAFHWIAPEIRFSKAAKVLRPGGILAVFGNVPVGLAPSLFADFRRIYAAHGFPIDQPPPESWYLPAGPVPQLFAESRLFQPATHRSYAWVRPFTSQSYADFLRTRSDHQMMEPDTREKVIDEVASAIVAHGDQFEMNYETHLHMARLAK